MNRDDLIYINIWDDYYDDGHVPDGETQSTHIFVEETDVPYEEQKEILTILLNFIHSNIDSQTTKFQLGWKEPAKISGIKFHNGWRIYVENISHKFREDVLLPALENQPLFYKDKKFNIISES